MDKKSIIEDEIMNSIKKHDEITRDSILKAQEIQFKDLPEQILSYDSFGFLKNQKDNQNLSRNIFNEEDIQKEHSRLIKWNIILNDYGKYESNNYSKLKSKTRKGVPDCLRTTVWQLFAKIDQLRDNKTKVYKHLLEGENDQTDESVIIKDLNRTFPKHVLFTNILGKGQRELYCVLTAYSKYNRETGYVQGMGFLTALFLTYMDEESAFWMLHSLMINYNLQSFFMKDFPGLRKSLYVYLSLMKKHIPKVYCLLRDKKVYPTMYAAQWFFTFFSCVFKFDILVRIFDSLLLEGFKVIYRIALGIMKVNENKLISKRGFEDLMNELRQITENVTCDSLLKGSFGISFSRKDIVHYENLYEQTKQNTKDELINQVMF